MEPVGIKNEKSDEKGADDGASTLQSGNDSASRTIEFTGVDGTLIGVEVVRSEEHGEESYITRLDQPLRREWGGRSTYQGYASPSDVPIDP